MNNMKRRQSEIYANVGVHGLRAQIASERLPARDDKQSAIVHGVPKRNQFTAAFIVSP